MVLLFILVACAAILGNNRNNSSGGAGGSTTASTTQSSASSQKQSKPAAEEPAPINLSGNGQQATDPFQLQDGLAIFKMTHQGDRNFSGTLLDSNGQRAGGFDSLLVNAIGPFNGSKAVQTTAGQYLIDLKAGGPWTITVEQPRPSSAPKTTSFEGNSQTATDLFQLPSLA